MDRLTRVLSRYLQFFFNLTLVLIFLYVVVQFIVTLQRDLQHRIAEETQGLVSSSSFSLCSFVGGNRDHTRDHPLQDVSYVESMR